jgi:hypothetical protein
MIIVHLSYPSLPPSFHLHREVLFGCLAIFGRELFMREVAVQIATLPPPMQEKSYRLMNRTIANLQDKVCPASLLPSPPSPSLLSCQLSSLSSVVPTKHYVPPFPPFLPRWALS